MFKKKAGSLKKGEKKGGEEEEILLHITFTTIDSAFNG
jgi:hypothetical protein